MPVPEDKRDAAAKPLRQVKRVASQAGEKADPSLRITAHEVLHLLEPEAVPVVLAKRRTAQRRLEERSIEANADQALAWCVNDLGFEEVTKKVLRLEQMRRRNEEYLSAARRARSTAATPSGENVVWFSPGPR